MLGPTPPQQQYINNFVFQLPRNVSDFYCVVATHVRDMVESPMQALDPPPLPEIRTRDTTPFTITGIDFTGALYVHNDNNI